MATGRRRSLSDLVEAADTGPPVELPAPPQPQATELSAVPSTPDTPPSPRIPPPSRTQSRSSKAPKYRTLERKEALLRDDQIEQLTELRRRLNRARGRGVGERITENTIIRVAIDLLLDHADKLHGVTEDELRNSVTSGLRE
ncbi:MAG: hypothetical protein ACXVBB_22350 [Isosphaeraceae bacterium]